MLTHLLCASFFYKRGRTTTTYRLSISSTDKPVT